MFHFPHPLPPTEAECARIASKRMAAAIRRGALTAGTLAPWKRRLDRYRAKSDRLSVLDFLHEYGAGIDAYCQSRAAYRESGQ